MERVLPVRFKQSILKSSQIVSEQFLKKVADEHVYRIKEREPVHDEKTFFGGKKWRKMYWPQIGLITHHEPVPKQKAIREWKLILGTFGDKFLNAKELDYYNRGLGKNTYLKNGKEIRRGD